MAERDFFTTLYDAETLEVILSPMMERLWYHLEDSKKTGYQRAFFAYGIYGLTKEWIGQGYERSIEDLCNLIFEMIDLKL